MSNFKAGNSRFSRFMNGRGFYIALALCLVAIGSAAYIAANKNFGLSTTNSSDTSAVSNYSPSETGRDLGDSYPAEQTNNTVSGVSDNSSSSAASSSSSSTASSSSSKRSSSGTASKANAAPTFFVLPVQGNVITAFSGDKLVYDKTMDDWRTHDGADIASDLGTPVKACADGTVTDITNDPLLGETVVITHGGGMTSIYANLASKVTVKKSQTVEAGQVIGAVGQTAQGEISLVSHLHFAMTKNGKYIDPIVTVGGKS